MPKVGMKPIRRKALIDATIAEIGQTGSLDVTVGQIAKRAGMSSGLAHHYFGGKEQMLLAAMRQILTNLQLRVRTNLRHAETPLQRVHAIIEANLDACNFDPDVVASWLTFYVQ
ncbi:MAG: transcriptional regulator BetI, partial [Amylibacter sp.]|nr:transcriptional regulator BetI [Amylibacter sp.]